MADLPAATLASLSQLVRDGRNTRNMTRVAFAQAVGISRMTLRLIEGGGPHQPTQETLNRLAKFLRLPVEQLTGQIPGALDLTGRRLRLEDEQIAREFHHAATDVKTALKRFFSTAITDDQRERFARILNRLQELPSGDPLLTSIEDLLAGAQPPDDQAIPKIEPKRGGKKG